MITENDFIGVKSEALDFLERSIYGLCLLLDVDIDALDSSIEIPVPETDDQYASYSSLKKQVLIHERLVGDALSQ